MLLKIIESYFKRFKHSCYCDYDNEVGAGAFIDFIRKHHKECDSFLSTKKCFGCSAYPPEAGYLKQCKECSRYWNDLYIKG